MSIAAGLPRFRRPDHHVIVSLVRPGQSVLDVGCGDGRLMALLRSECGSQTRGLELSAAAVSRCLVRGLAVVQGDAEKDLTVYPDDAFDCAVLSRSLQAMSHPLRVLSELVRIVPRILVSIENHGYWRYRMDFLLRGRGLVQGGSSAGLSMRMCSATDVVYLASQSGLAVTQAIAVGTGKRWSGGMGLLNLVSRQIVLVLERQPDPAIRVPRMQLSGHDT